MSVNWIVFGAGDGGARVVQLLTRGQNVVAFTDNDRRKVGRTFCGKPVIAPADITSWQFDGIVISNVKAAAAIYDQLVNELKIPAEQIVDVSCRNTFDMRLATLRLIASEIHQQNIEGACAELGVFKGEFAQYINECFEDRTLYLFDTFEGFDRRDIEIEAQDGHSDAVAREWAHQDVAAVLARMSHKERCVVMKGYFPESAAGVDDKFAFVNIDVDLYAPVYRGLEYFYERLTPGGYLLVHDYNSTRFGGVKEAVREFSREHRVAHVPLPDIGGSIVMTK
jgi:O-methyltransferase